jgi:hypothetical protein
VGIIEPPSLKGDNEEAKCPPSRGYHTKRHRAGLDLEDIMAAEKSVLV